MCYCQDTAVPRCATEDVRKTRKKQKYNPYISPPRVSLGKKLPSAHQTWILSISWRKLQVHNIPTNWDAGKNTLAFIASAAPCTVQSAKLHVRAQLWLAPSPEHATLRISACQVHSHAVVQAGLPACTQSVGSPAASCETVVQKNDRREAEQVALMFWGLLFQNHFHVALIDLAWCIYHHVIMIISFIFFLSPHPQALNTLHSFSHLPTWICSEITILFLKFIFYDT